MAEMPEKKPWGIKFSCKRNLPAHIKVTAVSFTGGAGSMEVEKETGSGCLNLFLSRHELHILALRNNWECDVTEPWSERVKHRLSLKRK